MNGVLFTMEWLHSTNTGKQCNGRCSGNPVEKGRWVCSSVVGVRLTEWSTSEEEVSMDTCICV